MDSGNVEAQKFCDVIDKLLHEIEEKSWPNQPIINRLARQAHVKIHDLSAMLSGNLEIRETVTNGC